MNKKVKITSERTSLRYEHRVFFAVVFISVLLIAILGFMLSSKAKEFTYNESLSADMNDGWSYMISDASGNLKEVGVADFPCSLNVGKDESVSFERIIPDKTDKRNLYLETIIVYMDCEVFINGESIFKSCASKGVKRFTDDFSMSNIVIPLPDEAAGASIRMEFKNSQGVKNAMFTEVAAGTYNDVLLYNLTNKPIRNMLPMVLLTLSLLTLLAELILSPDRLGVEAQRFFVFITFCVAFSLWTIFATVNTIQLSTSIGTLKLPGLVAFLVARMAYALFGLEDINRKSSVLRLTFWIVLVYSFVSHMVSWKRMRFEVCLFAAVILLQAVMRFYYTFIKKTRKKRMSDIGSFVLLVCTVVQLIKCIMDPINTIYLSVLCFGVVMDMVLKMLDILYIGLRNNVQRNELENEIYKKQTESLLERLNMHFLFNAFGVLNHAIISGNRKASGMCLSLSGWMRYTIDAFRKEGTVPLEEELEYVRDFIMIQQSRFGGMVQFEYDIEDSDFNVPRLSIQPFVENAINGLRKGSETGIVRIVTRRLEGEHRIIIANDGCGYFSFIGEKALEDIVSTGNRLKYMLQGNIEYRDEDEGTIVTIIIPEKEKRNESHSS